ncbi:MAG: TlpA family protein disulfide reductase [Planctomycetales bacterium]
MSMQKTPRSGQPTNGLTVVIWLVVVLLVFGGLFSRFFREDNPEELPGVGQTLAQLQLQGLGGVPSVALRDLKGSVVLVNFWGTWCPPCVEELPHIVALETAFRDRSDFRLLAVSCGGSSSENLGELESTTRQFLQERKMGMPVYADIGGLTRAAVGAAIDGSLGLPGYPTTILLDKQSIIQAVWIGYRFGSENQMRQQIERLLAE